MMKSISACFLVLVASVLMSGCGTSYSWRSNVPADKRAVFVPTFRNESDLQELGAVCTRQVRREFQREGTFKLCSDEDAALEVQGIVKSVSAGGVAYSRRTYGRQHASEMTAVVEVSVIDKRGERVLVDGRVYNAKTTLMSGQDITTAERDASGRLADDLSRQVIDDVLNLKW